MKLLSASALALMLASSQVFAAIELPKNFLPVPLVRQATNYSCGAAVLLSALGYWQVYDWNESSLYKDLETTPKDGTEPSKIVQVAIKFGLTAYYKERLTIKDLRKALKRGETVILDLQAWPDEKAPKLPWARTWEEGHYVILVGIDETYAYVMDPSTLGSYAYLPITELLERWHDYENRHGFVERDIHAGIFIKGKKKARTVPASLVRLE